MYVSDVILIETVNDDLSLNCFLAMLYDLPGCIELKVEFFNI